MEDLAPQNHRSLEFITQTLVPVNGKLSKQVNPLQHSSSPLPPQESNSKPHTVRVGRDDNVGCVDMVGWVDGDGDYVGCVDILGESVGMEDLVGCDDIVGCADGRAVGDVLGKSEGDAEGDADGLGVPSFRVGDSVLWNKREKKCQYKIVQFIVHEVLTIDLRLQCWIKSWFQSTVYT